MNEQTVQQFLLYMTERHPQYAFSVTLHYGQYFATRVEDSSARNKFIEGWIDLMAIPHFEHVGAMYECGEYLVGRLSGTVTGQYESTI